LLEGEGMVADYSCSDDGGSGLVSCVGPVADGAIVPNGLGAHDFTVTAEDGAGNRASAMHRYVVFDDIRGPIVTQSTFAAGRAIPIHLELGGRPAGPIFAGGSPWVRQVDCSTGDPIGTDAPAAVATNLNGDGRLQLLWRTDGGWAGTCRSLVLRFGLQGWSGADAVFTVTFA
jgi:hypothetical protein